MDAYSGTDRDSRSEAAAAGPPRREPSEPDPARPASAARSGHLDGISDPALSYISLEDTFGSLLERIRGSLGVDTAAVLLLDEDRGVLVARAARGLEEEVREGVQVPLARGFAGRIAAQGRPMVIEDLSQADVVNPILRQKGIRSMLGVPLKVEDRVIGVMHIGSLTPRRFDEDDVTLLQLAADRASLAIDNARLAEQRALTEIMQRTLLPDALPHVPGLRFSAKYLPAGSGVRIGGDWYDVFQLASGQFAFVIGDVVGRGVLAASVMAEIRTALRAYLLEGHPLPKVFALLNDLLFSMGRHRGATAAIIKLDLEQGELEAINAGHPPPLFVGPDGTASLLAQRNGPPLGVSVGAKYLTARFALPAGSKLLLYTDGLVERRGESIDEGLGRLRAAAELAAEDPEQPLAASVYQALVSDAPLDDDVALLAIEAVPIGASMQMTLEASPRVLAGLRATIRRWLVPMGVPDSDMFDIALATSEAASNAIEHAYGAREATFAVRCEHRDGEVAVAVEDAGRWRTSTPYGRGRGLAIMRALMDSVEIDRREEGTAVTLSKRIESTD